MVKGDFVICTSNLGYEDKLTIGETYQVRGVQRNAFGVGTSCRLRHSRSYFPANLFSYINKFRKEFHKNDVVCLAYSSAELPGIIKSKNFKKGTTGRIFGEPHKTDVMVDVEIEGEVYSIHSGLLYAGNVLPPHTLQTLLAKLEREIGK